MSAIASTAVPASRSDFERLMRTHNQRLFRVARSILKDDAEAEDALQDAYVQAYRKLNDFRGDAAVSTWLTRIVINQALMRLRQRKRDQVVVDMNDVDIADELAESPSDTAIRGEVRQLLEHRIDELPVAFRTVFVMREVEDMTVQEIGAALDIPESTVRTRLFRARTLLRQSLDRDMDTARTGVFGFDGARCDRIVGNVLACLGI